MVDVLLKYVGHLADVHELDFYDAAQALTGFQRSLALTAHLVGTGEIITKAPALRDARIIVSTPRPGSWEVVAMVVGGLWTAGTASKETPLGHMLYSIYDLIVRQSLGFPVDYGKSLYQQHEEQLAAKKITPAKLDSLAEKTEASLANMHRPIVASKTAAHANLFAGREETQAHKLGPEFNALTYDYIKQFEIQEGEVANDGIVSSYNINTFSGRLYMYDEERTIAFQLEDGARTWANIGLITSSLRSNALERGLRNGSITLVGRRITTSTGRLKAVLVARVQDINEAL